MKRLETSIVVFLTVLAVTSLWPFSGAEDVANARQNILVGAKTDFWGGFSQLFYSSFRMNEPLWHIVLGLVHAGLIQLGTLVSLRTLKIALRPKKDFYFLLIIHFIAVIYVLRLSRDGSLLAFAWLGTSLIFSSLNNQYFKFIKLTLGTIFFVFGLSFRPWLAITFVPLMLAVLSLSNIKALRQGRALILFASLAILMSPVFLDVGSKRIMNLTESYPEQQVMILDITSLACLSPEKSIQSAALTALQPISASPGLSREKLCGQFYPQNWASTVFYSNPSKPALHMIATAERKTYNTFRNSWINIITSRPTQYLQLKLIQISQLFFAGDSFTLSMSSWRELPILPYEILKALRLFSFLPILLLIVALTLSFRDRISSSLLYALPSTYLLAIVVVTLAFVGNNQRYISWLAMLLLFAFLNAPRLEKGVVLV
jgi:hypothetical protein